MSHKAEILKLFKETPHPEDSQIHALADSLKTDKHEFEDEIYAMLGDYIANDKTAEVSDKEKEEGFKIEHEHKDTITKLINKVIALSEGDDIPHTKIQGLLTDAYDSIRGDHNSEFPQYYTDPDGLLTMEKKLTAKKEAYILGQKIASLQIG